MTTLYYSGRNSRDGDIYIAPLDTMTNYAAAVTIVGCA